MIQKKARPKQDFYKRSSSRLAPENWPMSKPLVLVVAIANFWLLWKGTHVDFHFDPTVAGIWGTFSLTVIGGYFGKSFGEHFVDVSAQRQVDETIIEEECEDAETGRH